MKKRGSKLMEGGKCRGSEAEQKVLHLGNVFWLLSVGLLNRAWGHL